MFFCWKRVCLFLFGGGKTPPKNNGQQEVSSFFAAGFQSKTFTCHDCILGTGEISIYIQDGNVEIISFLTHFLLFKRVLFAVSPFPVIVTTRITFKLGDPMQTLIFAIVAGSRDFPTQGIWQCLPEFLTDVAIVSTNFLRGELVSFQAET